MHREQRQFWRSRWICCISFIVSIFLGIQFARAQTPNCTDAQCVFLPLVLTSPKLSKELHIFNWPDYVDPAILDDFEKEYGVKVFVDIYSSNEDMIAKIRSGNSGYDIVVPSDYAVDIMAREQWIAPLDKSLLSNLVHINPVNLNHYFDQGNVYSVPYFWGTTGIAYNKKFFSTPPDSWAVLLDTTKLEPLRYKFTMLDDERESPGAALMFKGKSINSTAPGDLNEIETLLKAQKPFVEAYDSSDVSVKLASEQIIIAHAWNTMAAQAVLAIGGDPSSSNIVFMIPKEGGAIWQDNLAIVADSLNKYTAHVFINFLLRPNIAARNTDYVLFLTPQ